jgi:hypothetical protein
MLHRAGSVAQGEDTGNRTGSVAQGGDTGNRTGQAPSLQYAIFWSPNAILIWGQLLVDHLHVDATTGVYRPHYEVDHNSDHEENERPTHTSGVG